MQSSSRDQADMKQRCSRDKAERISFARLISLVQSAKNCKRNVQKYFHDNLNRVMVTAKEDLASILPHKWVEPVTIPLVY